MQHCFVPVILLHDNPTLFSNVDLEELSVESSVQSFLYVDLL